MPELKGGLGAEFPVAISISTKSDIEKAIAHDGPREMNSARSLAMLSRRAEEPPPRYNPGNKAYTQYYWADVIGPMPDMAKGGAVPGQAMDRGSE